MVMFYHGNLKELSDESIKSPSASNKILNPSVNYVGTKARVKFNEDSLKQEKISFDHGKIVNIYTVWDRDRYVNISSYSTLIKLTKHVDIDPYKYSGYGFRFDRKEFFSIDDEVGRNVILFGVDMSSSLHIDDKKITFQFSVKILHKD